MTRAAFMGLLTFCLIAASSAKGQEESDAAGTKVQLRFANLLPISASPVSIKRGEELFVDNAKPGFFMPYQNVDQAGSSFQVSAGGRSLGEFKIEAGQGTAFFTAVALVLDSSPTVVCLRDDPPPPKKDDETPPPPPKRFRGYFGGFDFPYRVEVGKLGSWNVSDTGQLVDVPVTGNPPTDVRLRYVSRDGDEVDLYFPIDAAADRNSAFVSQRGLKRPRVRCYADNVLPAEDQTASLETPPSAKND